VMSYQMAGAVEAMQPLMNMITFTARSREKIIDLHARIADAVETQSPEICGQLLDQLATYTSELAVNVLTARATRDAER